MKHEDKVKQLTRDIIDSWDVNTLLDFIAYELYQNLDNLNSKELQEEWEDFYDRRVNENT